MKRIIDGKLYDAKKADKIATDGYWDGSNWDRHGRTKTLMKTKKGNFFVVSETRWQGEISTLEAINEDEAKYMYEELPEQTMDYKEAFGTEPEEA